MLTQSPPSFDAYSREQLIDLVLDLMGQIAQLRDQVSVLSARVVDLERELAQKGKPGEPPAFVKANRPDRSGSGQARKKRSEQFFRRLEEPTDFADHVPETCPDCGRSLSKGWIHRRRQVIEIVPGPVEITEHRIWARYCGVCGKQVLAKPDLLGVVLGGNRRLGVGLMSWIASLSTVSRLPMRQIQRLLAEMFRLKLSVGEISKVLQAVARKGSQMRADFVKEIRASPYVHADETGWREDGVNGYLWSFSTPSVRVYEFNHSRSGEVAESVLGEQFDNILLSDFYSAYNRFGCSHQRCWVHMLRDTHKLKETNPDQPQLLAWAESLEQLYHEAQAYKQDCLVAIAQGREIIAHGAFARQKRRREFEARLLDLAKPFVREHSRAGPPTSPQCVLAERCVEFAQELFTFVEHPQVPSDNNPAERAIRPAVIIRKISGGTRSPKGSETRTTLMSLFGTWTLQGKQPAYVCQQMLVGAQA